MTENKSPQKPEDGKRRGSDEKKGQPPEDESIEIGDTGVKSDDDTSKD